MFCYLDFRCYFEANGQNHIHFRLIQVLKTLFTWSGGPRSSRVGFFCFVSPRAWKQKKPTPLDRGPPLHVNRPLDFKILISDLKLNSKFENRFQRWDICFWKSDKGFEKLSLRTAVLHAYAWLAKRRPLFMRIVLQIPFRISRSNATSEIH